jgi:hypothetical protein
MCKYNSIDTIPAKVFFQILTDKNYQALKPKPKEKGLEEIFIAIYDEFFIKSDNPESKEYLKLTKQVAFLTYKINVVKQTLHYIYYTSMTKEMYLDIVKALKDGCGIEIDLNANLSEEVLRVLNIEVGIINNDLSIAKMDLEAMIKKSQSKAFDYEQRIVSMENVLNRNINDGIMLDKYIAYEKATERAVQQQNKKAA